MATCEAHLQGKNQREELNLSAPLRPFWLVRLKSMCGGFMLLSHHAIETGALIIMHLKDLQCHAVRPSSSGEDAELFPSCRDIKTGVFPFAYRSHAGISHWVSAGVWGLSLACLHRAAIYWTIYSCGNLTGFGVCLCWTSLVLTGVHDRRGHSDTGNWTLILSNTARWGRTGLGLWRLKSDFSCSRRRALRGSGRRVVIRTGEFADQVFDAAGSAQAWTAGQAFQIPALWTGSPGLLRLFFVGGLVRTKWWLGGSDLWRGLKEVNTITCPQDIVSEESEQQMHQVSGGSHDIYYTFTLQCRAWELSFYYTVVWVNTQFGWGTTTKTLQKILILIWGQWYGLLAAQKIYCLSAVCNVIDFEYC